MHRNCRRNLCKPSSLAAAAAATAVSGHTATPAAVEFEVKLPRGSKHVSCVTTVTACHVLKSRTLDRSERTNADLAAGHAGS